MSINLNSNSSQDFTTANQNITDSLSVEVQEKNLRYKYYKSLHLVLRNHEKSVLNSYDQYAISYFNKQIESKSAIELIENEIIDLFEQEAFKKYLYPIKNNKNIPNLRKLYSKILSKEENKGFFGRIKNNLFGF